MVWYGGMVSHGMGTNNSTAAILKVPCRSKEIVNSTTAVILKIVCIYISTYDTPVPKYLARDLA